MHDTLRIEEMHEPLGGGENTGAGIGCRIDQAAGRGLDSIDGEMVDIEDFVDPQGMVIVAEPHHQKPSTRSDPGAEPQPPLHVDDRHDLAAEVDQAGDGIGRQGHRREAPGMEHLGDER
jgi:hypothetical protein